MQNVLIFHLRLLENSVSAVLVLVAEYCYELCMLENNSINGEYLWNGRSYGIANKRYKVVFLISGEWAVTISHFTSLFTFWNLLFR